jgi:hypothetical protein
MNFVNPTQPPRGVKILLWNLSKPSLIIAELFEEMKVIRCGECWISSGIVRFHGRRGKHSDIKISATRRLAYDPLIRTELFLVKLIWNFVHVSLRKNDTTEICWGFLSYTIVISHIAQISHLPTYRK